MQLEERVHHAALKWHTMTTVLPYFLNMPYKVMTSMLSLLSTKNTFHITFTAIAQNVTSQCSTRRAWNGIVATKKMAFATRSLHQNQEKGRTQWCLKDQKERWENERDLDILRGLHSVLSLRNLLLHYIHTITYYFEHQLLSIAFYLKQSIYVVLCSSTL